MCTHVSMHVSAHCVDERDMFIVAFSFTRFAGCSCLEMEAVCTNINTHTQMCWKVDVHVEVTSYCLSSLFIITLLLGVMRDFDKTENCLSSSLRSVFSFAVANVFFRSVALCKLFTFHDVSNF